MGPFIIQTTTDGNLLDCSSKWVSIKGLAWYLSTEGHLKYTQPAIPCHESPYSQQISSYLMLECVVVITNVKCICMLFPSIESNFLSPLYSCHIGILHINKYTHIFRYNESTDIFYTYIFYPPHFTHITYRKYEDMSRFYIRLAGI